MNWKTGGAGRHYLHYRQIRQTPPLACPSRVQNVYPREGQAEGAKPQAGESEDYFPPAAFDFSTSSFRSAPIFSFSASVTCGCLSFSTRSTYPPGSPSFT